jgi:F-type H+-transporting ATPase subunit delta
LTADSSLVSGLAGRYVTALFDLAQAERQADATAAALDQVAALIDNNADLGRLIRSPVVAREDQAKAMAAVLAKAGIGGLAAKFVGLVTENRRLFLLPQMIRAFRVLLSQHRGEVAGEVVSAKALGQGQVEALRERLKKVAGADVRLSTRVDPAILGGLVVRLGSRMVDSSLRTKLFNLQNAMKEVG